MSSVTVKRPRFFVPIFCFSSAMASASFVACSDEPTEKAELGDAGALEDARVEASPPVDAAKPKPDAATEAGVDSGAPSSLPIPLTNVPDTPCGTKGGSTVVLYPATGDTPTFERIERVATRRLLHGARWEGIATFDEAADAGAPTPPVAPAPFFNHGATLGDTAGVVGSTGTDVVYQRYDSLTAPIGARLTLATAAPLGRPRVAGAANSALAVWASGGTVRARAIDGSGVPGTAFNLPGAATDAFSAALVATSATSYAVLWTTDDTARTYRTRFAIVSASTVVASVDVVPPTGVRHDVIAMVKTTSGYAALLGASDQGGLAPVPHVLFLDANGARVGNALRLDGASAAFAIASRGTEVGVVAWRKTKEIEFRALGATGSPLAPWVCLDAPTTGANASAGIDADGTGYAVVYRTPAEAEALVRFGPLGQ